MLIRRLLSVSAWTVVGCLAIGLLTALDPVRDWFDGPGAVTGAVIIVLFVAAAVMLWILAVWHAVVDPNRTSIPRWLIVVLLVGTNFGGALLYYFGYVVRQPPTVNSS